jgi:hypothetical protein
VALIAQMDAMRHELEERAAAELAATDRYYQDHWDERRPTT